MVYKMNEEKLYTIGQASKICEVSARMLRYYEEIGLIKPDRIDESSHYRYYGIDTLRTVQIIRYFIDEGFSLGEVSQLMLDDDINSLYTAFEKHINETKEQIDFYHQRLDSLRAWRDLIVEGLPVLEHDLTDVSVRFIRRDSYFRFHTDIPSGSDASAYIETEYYTQSKQNGHSMIDVGGAFNLLYDSYEDRMSGNVKDITILQVSFPNSKSREQIITFGGFIAVTAYHIGSLHNVAETYERMISWAQEHGFKLAGNCCERQIIDIYTSRSEEKHVTELMLPLDEDCSRIEITVNENGLNRF